MEIRNLGSVISDEIRKEWLLECIEKFPWGQTILDVGCGNRPYESIYLQKSKLAFGVDVPFTIIGSKSRANIDVYADLLKLPFVSDFFSLVICTEVLEHVPNPEVALDEIARALRPGGFLILTTPFLVPEHDAPYDFYRYTRFGLRFLLEKHGFSVVTLSPKGDLLGVSIAAIVRYQLKIWHGLAKITRMKFWASSQNPLIWLFVLILQKGYLIYFKTAIKKPSSFIGKLHQVFQYGCLGFMVLALRNEIE